MNTFKNNTRRGQGMVEYIIIVVVVGIFCIGIFMALGVGVNEQTGHSTSKLVGISQHDQTIDNSGSYGYVLNEEVRENKMTGE